MQVVGLGPAAMKTALLLHWPYISFSLPTFCRSRESAAVASALPLKLALAQMFLRDQTEGARGHASYFWIGLAWREAQLTWVDGTPISQSWYR